jgi:conjugative transfer signal peptidase TraF
MKHDIGTAPPIRTARAALPSWNQLLAPVLMVTSVVLVAAGLTFLMRHFRVGLTSTDSSCAKGFYRVVDGPLRRGELVAACLSANAGQEGLARGYLGRGDCPGGAEPVLKVIAGLRGDQVDVEAGWISVNGERLARSATIARDSAGRLLTHVAWGKRQVGRDEVWLVGLNNLRSWDSRYFGPIPLRAIRGVAESLLTW